MKKFIKENRVFVFLVSIIILCFVIIICLLLKYFYFGNLNNAPKRTCKDIPLTLQSQIVETLKVEKQVDNVELTVADKSNIFYIKIYFGTGTDLASAKGKATSVLEMLSEDIKSCYDINFMLTKAKDDKQDGFNLMGARNVHGSNVVWNNYNNVVN